MLDLLSEKQLELYGEFKSFAKENIDPYAEQWETKEEVPSNIITKCGKKGYLGSTMPGELGGLEWDMVTYGIFTAAIAESSTSLAGQF